MLIPVSILVLKQLIGAKFLVISLRQITRRREVQSVSSMFLTDRRRSMEAEICF